MNIYNTYLDYPPEEREARRHLDALRNFVESLPAEIYNENREYWDGKIRAAEILLDKLIDRRLGESGEDAQEVASVTAYELERALDEDGTYPSPIISGGEVLYPSYAVAIDPDEPPADMADDFPF